MLSSLLNNCENRIQFADILKNDISKVSDNLSLIRQLLGVSILAKGQITNQISSCTNYTILNDKILEKQEHSRFL